LTVYLFLWSFNRQFYGEKIKPNALKYTAKMKTPQRSAAFGSRGTPKVAVSPDDA
jgi:hypothetical protein